MRCIGCIHTTECLIFTTTRRDVFFILFIVGGVAGKWMTNADGKFCGRQGLDLKKRSLMLKYVHGGS
jgi:hypothetical protein